MSIDLKPCPFCGAPVVFFHTEYPAMWVECYSCGARGPVACDEYVAAEARNERDDEKEENDG